MSENEFYVIVSQFAEKHLRFSKNFDKHVTTKKKALGMWEASANSSSQPTTTKTLIDNILQGQHRQNAYPIVKDEKAVRPKLPTSYKSLELNFANLRVQQQQPYFKKR